jgi:opacity protein-like surface antigen
MRSLLLLLVAVSALLAHSLEASAQDEEMAAYARPGCYMGVGIAGASYTETSDLFSDVEDVLRNLGYAESVEADTAVGLHVSAGYRAHPSVAVEAEFEMMPASDAKVFGILKIAEIQTWALTANARVFPITGRLQPFVLMGVGLVRGEWNLPPLPPAVGVPTPRLGESDLGFAGRFGGGVDFYLTESFALSAKVSYVVSTGDQARFDYVSFGGGAQYRF